MRAPARAVPIFKALLRIPSIDFSASCVDFLSTSKPRAMRNLSSTLSLIYGLNSVMRQLVQRVVKALNVCQGVGAVPRLFPCAQRGAHVRYTCTHAHKEPLHSRVFYSLPSCEIGRGHV